MPHSFVKSNNYNQSDGSPEKKLFIAILSQAVHDAFAPHVPRLEKQAARNFLTSNSTDFKHICEMAGRDHDYVREKIRKKVLKANGWNVDITVRTTPPRTRKIRKKYKTGNTYYAEKRKLQEAAAIH